MSGDVGSAAAEYPPSRVELPAGDIGRLLLRCVDRPGLVAAVSTFLAEAGANIVSLGQHATSQSGGTFMQRTVFHLPGLAAAREGLERDFAEKVAEPYAIDFRLTEAAKPKRVAIMASKTDHCLLDLLWRNRRGELDMSVVMVISNHPDLAEQVRPFGVPFIHIPATKDIREQAEQRLLELLNGNVDLVVLARYMQIITPDFLAQVGCPLINIHHSFLPAFIGAAPYRRARERGVKLVGATAHYVTSDLDEGPIIEQDVVRVDHRHDVDDLVRLGADVERAVLSRAVSWHCEDRILRDGNQTVVF
jgi:formyltetrahydrofolate deformylase